MAEKKIMHYSSSQKILLVGEGNFSFAACLATAFGSANNIVATTLDSKESFMDKYPDAVRKWKKLKGKGCVVLHQVDVDTMSQHPLLAAKLFDRVVFNFPHAGFIGMESQRFQIELHQDLVKRFFAAASAMLTGRGEVHVTHKTANPFSRWNIVKLAEEVGLYLVEEAPFKRADYPGYLNKKGSGRKCNRTFRVGQCSTYKFAKLPLRLLVLDSPY
ncbi:uncharacterized protein At4g26485-like isoform X3 [Malus sylvestris]|uniref:uncharacterized protein At4g26485-like isoform X3 n=1 Tax=Malus sylvestris TaxID=3752 RepID=UPI0021AC035B|nr:uncharacterized protein At4g26485-like isoform X3 [Malus sylvestris]